MSRPNLKWPIGKRELILNVVSTGDKDEPSIDTTSDASYIPARYIHWRFKL